MVATPYDPYNSPLDGGQDPSREPQIFLFPFSDSAISKISAVPRKFRVDAPPPSIENKLPPSLQSFSSASRHSSSNDEIADLKRRLQEIKVKRARLRDRSLQGQSSLEGSESYSPKKDTIQPSHDIDIRSLASRNQPSNPRQIPTLRNEPIREQEYNPNDASLPISSHKVDVSASELLPNPLPIPLRRPSLTFETATETLDTSFDSKNGSIFNPKRLLCSSYKPIEHSEVEKNTAQAKGRSTETSMTTSSSRALYHDRERAMNVLDSLVCMRPGKGDPLDLIICSSPPTEETIVTSSESLTTGYTFDPYYSTGGFSTSLAKPRAKSDPVGRSNSSVFLDYESTTLGLGDGVSSKSCTSSRRSPPAWYQRPDSINTSEIKQQVMEMVFYSRNPNEPFDCHSRLSESMLRQA